MVFKNFLYLLTCLVISLFLVVLDDSDKSLFCLSIMFCFFIYGMRVGWVLMTESKLEKGLNFYYFNLSFFIFNMLFFFILLGGVLNVEGVSSKYIVVYKDLFLFVLQYLVSVAVMTTGFLYILVSFSMFDPVLFIEETFHKSMSKVEFLWDPYDLSIWMLPLWMCFEKYLDFWGLFLCKLWKFLFFFIPFVVFFQLTVGFYMFSLFQLLYLFFILWVILFMGLFIHITLVVLYCVFWGMKFCFSPSKGLMKWLNMKDWFCFFWYSGLYLKFTLLLLGLVLCFVCLLMYIFFLLFIGKV